MGQSKVKKLLGVQRRPQRKQQWGRETKGRGSRGDAGPHISINWDGERSVEQCGTTVRRLLARWPLLPPQPPAASWQHQPPPLAAAPAAAAGRQAREEPWLVQPAAAAAVDAALLQGERHAAATSSCCRHLLRHQCRRQQHQLRLLAGPARRHVYAAAGAGLACCSHTNGTYHVQRWQPHSSPSGVAAMQKTASQPSHAT